MGLSKKNPAPTAHQYCCKLFRVWLLSILCLALFWPAGCASPPRNSAVYHAPSPRNAPRSAATAAKDTLILGRIKSKIFSDDLVSQGDADIIVRHGVVYLEGKAGDHYQGRMLADLIRTVDGVVRVENHLQATRTGTSFVSPNEFVSEKIKMRFLKESDLNDQPLLVETTTRHVVLSGSVATQVQKQKAAAIAFEHAGDRQVIDRISVTP